MGNKCHAMSESAREVKADDNRWREEDIKRMIDSYRPYSLYDLVMKKNNCAKIEIEIPKEDYKPLIILTDITDYELV